MTETSQSKTRKRAGRGALKHGGYSLLATGKVPLNRDHVRKYLTKIREGFCQDLGGESQMSTSEVVMLDRLINALGVTRLIEEFIREKGVIDKPGGFLNPALHRGYIAFSNQVRLATQMLEAAVKERAKGRAVGSQAEIEAILTSYSRQDDPVKLEFEFAKAKDDKEP